MEVEVADWQLKVMVPRAKPISITLNRRQWDGDSGLVNVTF